LAFIFILRHAVKYIEHTSIGWTILDWVGGRTDRQADTDTQRGRETKKIRWKDK
jgi:hypothetical protein